VSVSDDVENVRCTAFAVLIYQRYLLELTFHWYGRENTGPAWISIRSKCSTMAERVDQWPFMHGISGVLTWLERDFLWIMKPVI
jgi:hypothetical protein